MLTFVVAMSLVTELVDDAGLVEALHANGLTRFLSGVAGSGEGLPGLLQLAGAGAGAANAVNNPPAYLALEPAGDSPVRAPQAPMSFPAAAPPPSGPAFCHSPRMLPSGSRK